MKTAIVHFLWKAVHLDPLQRSGAKSVSLNRLSLQQNAFFCCMQVHTNLIVGWLHFAVVQDALSLLTVKVGEADGFCEAQVKALLHPLAQEKQSKLLISVREWAILLALGFLTPIFLRKLQTTNFSWILGCLRDRTCSSFCTTDFLGRRMSLEYIHLKKRNGNK